MRVFILILILINSLVQADCEYMYGQYYTWYGSFDFEDYVFGEDNCCDEYPLPLCGDDRVFFEKEDYADYTNPENWDIISENVALTRADRRGLYNPLFEDEYVRGETPWEYEGLEYASPIGTLWRFTANYAANSETAVNPVVSYTSWITWGLYGTYPQRWGMYSPEDDSYYDFFITSWTSGDGTGFGWGDGNGSGNGGGFSYYRSGPIKPIPTITNIEDVPNDQGGRVYITFDRSPLDVNSHPHGIDIYTIQRFDSPDWIGLGSIGALGESSYIYEASTLLDSLGQGNDSTSFRVIALNYVMGYTFYSEIYNGQSIDNIPPGVPNGLNASWEDSQVYISWNPNVDEDFQYYDVEKDTDAAFPNAQTFYTAENFFLDQDIDQGMIYYYRIRSIDDAGNYSDYSEVVQMSTLSNQDLIAPNSFYLHQNYPNPFNPTTRINFDISNDGDVLIKIMDVKGNHIRTLVNNYVQIGFKSILWNAKNDDGKKVPAGVYFYTLQTIDYLQTKKMILLK